MRKRILHLILAILITVYLGSAAKADSGHGSKVSKEVGILLVAFGSIPYKYTNTWTDYQRVFSLEDFSIRPFTAVDDMSPLPYFLNNWVLGYREDDYGAPYLAAYFNDGENRHRTGGDRRRPSRPPQ